MGIYWYNHYYVFEQDGKYGLVYDPDGEVLPGLKLPADPKILVPPIFSSVQIINEDVSLTEAEINALEKNSEIISCGEMNYPIVVADGKQGLIHCSKIILPIKYDRIIKLTVAHYLYQECSLWTLYSAGYQPLPAFEWTGELTLENMLNQLNRVNGYLPRYQSDFDSLSRRLYREPGNSTVCRYISEYRLYSGWEMLGTLSHDIDVNTERVIIGNDFQTTHFDKIYP